MRKKEHIDDAQPATVEEHYKLLCSEESLLNPEHHEVTPDNLPEWFDEDLYRAGQKYVQRNLLGTGIAGLTGLIVVLTIPTTIDILIYTKKSGTPCTAFKRYLETLLHIRKLYTEDVKNPNSDWYRSINAIRQKHSMNARKCVKAGVGKIYQKDMALTQFGFIGYTLTASEILGLTDEPSEREAFNHVWRVIGHMLDIDDRINICRKNATETTELCRMILNRTFKKYLIEIQPHMEHMILTMLNGFWYIDVTINAESVFSFTYKMSGLEYKRPLGWLSWISTKRREILLKMCRLPYIGVITRTYFNYFLRITYWTLERYPLLAWLCFGKDNVQITLYPKKK